VKQTLRSRLALLLLRSGIRVSARRFVAGSLAISVVLALLLGFAENRIGIPLVPAIVVMFILSILGCVMFLVLRSDARLQFIENTLPDALDLMAANLRAGLTTDRALILASRPEFGPLQEELDRTGREVALGRNIIESLNDLASRTGSERIRKTLALVTSGLRSGGKLAELLTQASSVLKQQAAVQRKVASTVTVHVIFIFATVAFGAPFLFAVSAFLVEMMGNILQDIPTATPQGYTPFTLGASGLPLQQVIILSVLLLCTISVMASLFAGQIIDNRPRAGLKYAPFLLAASLACFFLVRAGVKTGLGALFGAQ